MKIRGYLLDIQPRQARPTLALYFDAKHRSALPRGEREAIVLDIEEVRWHTTVNSTNGNNAPYVHNRLTRDDGTSRACTEVFMELGLGEKAQLEFELKDSNNFVLMRVTDKGKWRPGNAPQERFARVGILPPLLFPSEDPTAGSFPRQQHIIPVR
jgi:hypothetical protein